MKTGEICKKLSPYTYIVAMPNGSERHLYANKIRKIVIPTEHVGIISENDTDFGWVLVVPPDKTTSLPSERTDLNSLSHLWNGGEQEDNKYIPVKCPAVVPKYNSKMDGVDMIDRMISYYRTRARTKKWTVRTVFHFFDLAVTNALIQYRDDRRQFGDSRKEIAQVTFSDFCLINGLFIIFCIHIIGVVLTATVTMPVCHHPSVSDTLPCHLSIAGVLDIIGHRWQLQASRHDVAIRAVPLGAKSSACSAELTCVWQLN